MNGCFGEEGSLVASTPNMARNQRRRVQQQPHVAQIPHQPMMEWQGVVPDYHYQSGYQVANSPQPLVAVSSPPFVPGTPQTRLTPIPQGMDLYWRKFRMHFVLPSNPV